MKPKFRRRYKGRRRLYKGRKKSYRKKYTPPKPDGDIVIKVHEIVDIL